jgi:hypothetical protein
MGNCYTRPEPNPLPSLDGYVQLARLVCDWIQGQGRSHLGHHLDGGKEIGDVPTLGHGRSEGTW